MWRDNVFMHFTLQCDRINFKASGVPWAVRGAARTVYSRIDVVYELRMQLFVLAGLACRSTHHALGGYLISP